MPDNERIDSIYSLDVFISKTEPRRIGFDLKLLTKDNAFAVLQRAMEL